GRIELGLLRQIADAHPLCGPGLPNEVIKLPRHDLEQRRLAGAVHPDDADLGAGKKRQRNIPQNRLAPRIGLGELMHVIDILGVRHGRFSSFGWLEIGAPCSAYMVGPQAGMWEWWKWDPAGPCEEVRRPASPPSACSSSLPLGRGRKFPRRPKKLPATW